MITREADYAIRTIACLAGHGVETQQPVSMADVSKQMNIPYRFLRKLARRLVQAGLVQSRRGKHGGLILTRSPASITLLDAIQGMAPDAAQLSPCLTNPKQCRRSGYCRVHAELRRIQQQTDLQLDQVTFDHLTDPE